MPHQCVRCNTFYEDGAKEIISGCKCGAKLFFYIKKERLEDAKKAAQNLKLSTNDKNEIEKDVFDLIGSNPDLDQPVVLDFESIRVLKPGQYEVDLVNLFRHEPLIFKLEEGKYMIDIDETFNAVHKMKKGKKR